MSSNLKQAKENCQIVLNSLCKNNLDKLIFAHLNTNLIRNKFGYLFEQIRSNVDILLVLETKIDDSILQGQFVIDGFSAPYTVVELRLFCSLPDGQVTSKSDFHPGIFTCSSLQMLWQRRDTTKTIEKYYVTYVNHVRLRLIDFIDRNFS